MLGKGKRDRGVLQLLRSHTRLPWSELSFPSFGELLPHEKMCLLTTEYSLLTRYCSVRKGKVLRRKVRKRKVRKRKVHRR